MAKLYCIYFPEDGAYYVGHEEGTERSIKSISVDKNLNCVIGIGKEKNARALAGYLTAFTGHTTEVRSFERVSKVCDTVGVFKAQVEEVPDVGEDTSC